MERHKAYWVQMTAYLKDDFFKGDKKKFDEYVKSSFAIAEPIMERYAKEGNEWWLTPGDDRAFYQTLEPKFLMPSEVYEKEMQNFLGRKFTYNEIASNDIEERNKKLLAIRKEAMNVYKTKYPQKYKEFIKRQNEIMEQRTAKELDKTK